MDIRLDYGRTGLLVQLPDDQSEALLLVGASGFSYEEAAKICGCAVGTIKSRVSRARTRLAELMSIEGPKDVENPLPGISDDPGLRRSQ